MIEDADRERGEAGAVSRERDVLFMCTPVLDEEPGDAEDGEEEDVEEWGEEGEAGERRRGAEQEEEEEEEREEEKEAEEEELFNWTQADLQQDDLNVLCAVWRFAKWQATSAGSRALWPPPRAAAAAAAAAVLSSTLSDVTKSIE